MFSSDSPGIQVVGQKFLLMFFLSLQVLGNKVFLECLITQQSAITTLARVIHFHDYIPALESCNLSFLAPPELQHPSISSPTSMKNRNESRPGKTQKDRVEREVGGGIGMGNTCISKADSCPCMTRTTTIL